MVHYLYRDDNGIFRVGSLSNQFFIFTTGEGGVPVLCTGSPSSIAGTFASGFVEYYCNGIQLGAGTGYIQWSEPEETGDCDIYYELGSYYYSLMTPSSYTDYNNGDEAVYIKSETPDVLPFNATYGFWEGNITFYLALNDMSQRTAYFFDGLGCNSKYAFAVRACNTSGCGPWTDIKWNALLGPEIGSFAGFNDPAISLAVNTNQPTIDVDYSFDFCDNCVGSGTPITNPLISGFIYDYNTDELISTTKAYQRESTLMFSNPIPQGVSGLYYIEVKEDLYLYNGVSGNVICYNRTNSDCGKKLYYLEHI
jgi:hypothetical protein